MKMLTFIVLMLATPSLPIIRRTLSIVIGVVLFIAVDYFAVQYMIFPQKPTGLAVDSPIFTSYTFIKWLMPFLLWIIATHPYLGGLINRAERHSRKRKQDNNCL
jgi:hypothetical protein